MVGGQFMAVAKQSSRIADALFTKTQQRVLAIFFGQTEKSYYLNQVVRHADMGKGVIQRELNKLTACGLLVVSRQGNQNHYQANKQSPIFDELKSIVVKTFGVAEELKGSLESLSTQLDFAFVYGSMSKGDEHSESDIDIMLVGKDLSYSQVMEMLDDSEQRLGRTINPTILSLSEFKQRIENKQNFITQVIAQPKIWLFGESKFKTIAGSISLA